MVGNGRLMPEITANEVEQALMVANQLCGVDSLWRRSSMLNGGQGSGIVNLDKECGYCNIAGDAEYFHREYVRGTIAHRIVNIWPDECWSAQPEIYETEKKRLTSWESKWNDLSEKMLAIPYLHRADRLSRIGRFGVVLLGINDGRALSEPAPNINPNTGEQLSNPKEYNLNYIRAFEELEVSVVAWETDTSSPRFGYPRSYTIQLANPTDSLTGASITSGSMSKLDVEIHWSRVVHLADNLLSSSEIFGIPAQEPVANILYDLKKVQGGSAEMFWKGGFPGYAFEAYPNDLGITSVNLPGIRKEILAYTLGFQRYLTSQGGKWNSLAMQVANPKPHIEQYINLICAAINVPVRIFMGTESGHLASTQDAGTWKDRLHGRQLNYLEPRVVRRFINRLMDIGILPRIKKYSVSWRDLRALSDKDRADVALKQVQSLMQYVSGNCNQVMPQRLLYTLLMGLTEAQADTIEAYLKENPPPPPIPTGPVATAGGGRKGNVNRRPAGRPKGGPAEGEAKPLTP